MENYIEQLGLDPDRFQVFEEYDGVIGISDSKNDYTIYYCPPELSEYDAGFYAYDSDGNQVYEIDSNGAVKLFLDNGNTVSLKDKIGISDISPTMEIINVKGNKCTISNRKLTKSIAYDDQGNVICTRYYNSDGSYHKEMPNGQIIVCDSKGNFKLILEPDGTYSIPKSEIKGTYSIDENGNIICENAVGETMYYNSSGVLFKRIDKEGIIYDLRHAAQIKNINGKQNYSKINHIEYDEEAYNNILNSLNSISGSYKGVAKAACSNIVSAVNSFPDSYSCGNIGDIGSGIEGHINLISSLGEMTNYSLLAYQTCDEELKNSLNSLIDSIFGDSDNILSNWFKDEIKDSIEENDGIIGYKEDTNFKNVNASNVFQIYDFMNKFKPERFNLTIDEVYEELQYIKNTRGRGEMNYIMNGLINNCPSNYFEFSFNPSSECENWYDFNNQTIGNYQTNSEIITINDCYFEFAQVLPKDCTNIELLAYNFAKANVINTMRTLPKKYLQGIVDGGTVVLTCDYRSQIHDSADWAGYYNDDLVVIDVHGSLYDNAYYTQDTLIHEFGHRFSDLSDMMMGNDLISDNSTWYDYYDDYKGVIPNILEGGYTEEGFEEAGLPRDEFFAESMAAYFIKPRELKELCPRVYNEITKLLGGDYGGSSINGVNASVSVSASTGDND